MLFGIDPQLRETFEVEFLDIIRCRLQHDLVLIVMLHAVRIFPVAAVCRTTTGLRIGGPPGFGAERTQEGGRMKGTGSHLHIVRLLNDATPIRPKPAQRKNEVLIIHKRSNDWF